MIDYYDRDGNPLTLEEWADLFQPDYQIVAKTLTEAGEVSTVWIGINHQWGPGPPLVFETMVFEEPGDPSSDNEMRRYSTEEEALRGHLEVVERLGGPIGVPSRP